MLIHFIAQSGDDDTEHKVQKIEEKLKGKKVPQQEIGEYLNENLLSNKIIGV